LLAVAAMVGLLVWTGWWSRKRPWWQVVTVGLLVPAVYCGLAFLYVSRWPVPMPSVTPYDAIPAQRAVYLRSYEIGYRESMVGFIHTYCFYPQVETRGFYDGSYRGELVWSRLLGLRLTADRKRLIEKTAARDGVSVDLK